MMRPRTERTKGAGLVLTCIGKHQQRVLLLEEETSKPSLGKIAGMHSIPMETLKPLEDVHAGIRRLIEEELPGLEHAIANWEPLGLYQVASGVWLEAYHASCREELLPDVTRVAPDVGKHYWTSMQEALQHRNLRPGAWEPLHDFTEGRRSVRCERCRGGVYLSNSLVIS